MPKTRQTFRTSEHKKGKKKDVGTKKKGKGANVGGVKKPRRQRLSLNFKSQREKLKSKLPVQRIKPIPDASESEKMRIRNNNRIASLIDTVTSSTYDKAMPNVTLPFQTLYRYVHNYIGKEKRISRDGLKLLYQYGIWRVSDLYKHAADLFLHTPTKLLDQTHVFFAIKKQDDAPAIMEVLSEYVNKPVTEWYLAPKKPISKKEKKNDNGDEDEDEDAINNNQEEDEEARRINKTADDMYREKHSKKLIKYFVKSYREYETGQYRQDLLSRRANPQKRKKKDDPSKNTENAQQEVVTNEGDGGEE